MRQPLDLVGDKILIISPYGVFVDKAEDALEVGRALYLRAFVALAVVGHMLYGVVGHLHELLLGVD